MTDIPADVLTRLQKRVDDWKPNSDTATVSVKLGDLRAAVASLSDRTAQAERIRRLEEALRDGVRATTHALMVLPMPELGRHKRAWSTLVDWRDAARAAIGGNADA